MPIRWSIPIPGPFSWVPSRKPKQDPFRHVTDDQWQRIGEGIAGRVQRHHDRTRRVADRLERFDEQVQAADRRDRDYHRDRMAELAEIRQLPAWPRFKAAMGFTVGRRHTR